MNKYILLILTSLGLISCSGQDGAYYLSNPAALQQALKKCPEKQPSGLSCQQLEDLGKHMNELAYQLQSSPQGFGTKILGLQETIAKQQDELKRNKKNAELKASLQGNQKELADLFAVVKWLESPGNS